MKKLIIVLFSLIFLVLFLFFENWKIDEDQLGIEVLTQEEIDEKVEGKEFKFFEVPLTFNESEIGYDSGQNMLLIPQKIDEIHFEGKVSSSEELFFLEDEIWKDKSSALKTNHVFRLYRVSDTQYWMYNVYFTGLPIASITSDTDNSEEDHENDMPGQVWVYDQYRKGTEFQKEECIFRIRGASSRGFPKKSYKIELLNNKLSFLGMRKDEDWILNALYDDEGLIHNKISYELWHEIASSNHVTGDEGVSMEYVELFIDGAYQGVYGLLERVDKKQLELNDMDKLYKGVGTDLVGEDDFYLQLNEEMEPVFEINYPKEIREEDWEPLKNWYNRLHIDGNMSLEDGASILNMENAIDYLLFNLYICNSDNTLKNIYYWADYQEDGSYRITKVPWDLNMTWGNVYEEEHEYHFNVYKEEVIEKDWGWTDDMYHIYQNSPNEMGMLISSRWEELRNEIITTENIFPIIESQLAYLHSSGARIRESLFWGSREAYWNDNYLYDYAEKKITMMDEYMEKLKNGESLQ